MQLPCSRNKWMPCVLQFSAFSPFCLTVHIFPPLWIFCLIQVPFLFSVLFALVCWMGSNGSIYPCPWIIEMRRLGSIILRYITVFMFFLFYFILFSFFFYIFLPWLIFLHEPWLLVVYRCLGHLENSDMNVLWLWPCHYFAMKLHIFNN